MATGSDNKVIVIWISSQEAAQEGYVNVLSSSSGTRVYDKDELDPRAGECDFYPQLGLALQEMKPGPEGAVQIPLKEAQKYGLA